MKKLSLVVAAMLQASLAFGAWPLALPWMNAVGGQATYTSADHPNSVFVVEAYFNGCHWCHQNAPKVGALAAEFQGNDRVQFVDVGVDGEESEYQAWISSTNPNHPVLKDPDGASYLGDFAIQGYPTTVVVDCHGKELFRHEGYWEDTGADEVRQAVKSGLAANCK